jgi:hypothetical protein
MDFYALKSSNSNIGGIVREFWIDIILIHCLVKKSIVNVDLRPSMFL